MGSYCVAQETTPVCDNLYEKNLKKNEYMYMCN